MFFFGILAGLGSVVEVVVWWVCFGSSTCQSVLCVQARCDCEIDAVWLGSDGVVMNMSNLSRCCGGTR